MTKHENTHEKERSESKKDFSKNFGRFHDKNYKKLLLIPLALIFIGVVYMFFFYSSTGDFIYRDISLTGGTSVTLINENLDANVLELELAAQLEDVQTREIYDFTSGRQEAIIVETKSGSEHTQQVLESYLGYSLNEENSSIEFTGSSLSQSFFKQLLIAILVAFVFMAIVVFIIFRTFIPSTAIIISAFADIFMTLVLANILGIEMSTAGIVAFLMLIGYSVDTDILLTNRILKRTGNLNEKIYSAFKTGTTMTFTSLIAIGIALIFAISFSIVLTQIFLILFIGLAFDLLNTWITNVSILKWYAIKKEIKK